MKQARRFNRLGVILVVSCSGSINIQLLIAVIPLVSSQMAGPAAAGYATVALTAGMVLIQLLMPELLARFSHRSLMAAGLLLLGIPAALYLVSTNPYLLLLLTAVRGLGAGIVTVIWTILVVSYGDPTRRGNDFGFFSMATGLIAVVGAPAGLAILGLTGLGTLGLMAGGISILGAVIAIFTLSESEPIRTIGLISLVQSGWRRMLPTVLVFTSTMCGFAVMTSFLPPWSPRFAPAGLLLVGLGSAFSRFIAGRVTDHYRPDTLLLPGLGMSAAGMAVVSVGMAYGSAGALLLGCFLFGTGAGSLIVSSYLTLMWRAPSDRHTALASLWNAVYDAGLAVGGLVFSPLAAGYGYLWTFVGVTSLLTVLIPAFAWLRIGASTSPKTISAELQTDDRVIQ